MRSSRFTGLVAAAAAFALTACSEDGAAVETAADRGEKIYRNVCITCHAADPGEDSTLGPPVAGASEALLGAKVVHGDYPPGYTPKRATRQMPPLPYLKDHIPDIAAYLKAAAG